MAAPKGNKFWEVRSKHGRDKIFATPALMWEAAVEYFEWCIQNPINDPRSFGGKANIQRPFTLQGLTAYLGVNTVYFNHFEKDCSEDFSKVINDIKEAIYRQKYENAAIGVYNQNIIARDLGLTDNNKTEIAGELSLKQITGMEVL
jgi:hypothetical protein